MIRDMTASTPRPSPLINDEADRQVRVLEALRTQLQAFQIPRERPGLPMILDTNVLMHYQRLDRVPWAEVFKTGQVRLVLPVCVINELGNKKYTGSDEMSGRADLAPRALRQYGKELRPGSAAAFEDGTTLEVFLDKPGHQRKINLDEELLSRSVVPRRVIERPVIIVTGDFGMQLRIDARGLDYAEMPDKYAKDNKRRQNDGDDGEVAVGG
jgi:predicted ribonuclease YlaK